jgi:hypothetical protein
MYVQNLTWKQRLDRLVDSRLPNMVYSQQRRTYFADGGRFMSAEDLVVSRAKSDVFCLWVLRIGMPVALIVAMARPLSATTIVSDPAGDAWGQNDIVEISGAYSSDTLYLGVKLAPATYMPDKLWCTFFLDTDQNPATGTPSGMVIVNPCGAEYSVDYLAWKDSPLSPDTATLYQYSDCTYVATDLPVIHTADGVFIAVSLSLIHDDGAAGFGSYVCDMLDPGVGQGSDLAGYGGGAGAMTFITSPVPEPTTAVLLVSALVAILFFKRRGWSKHTL